MADFSYKLFPMELFWRAAFASECNACDRVRRNCWKANVDEIHGMSLLKERWWFRFAGLTEMTFGENSM